MRGPGRRRDWDVKEEEGAAGRDPPRRRERGHGSVRVWRGIVVVGLWEGDGLSLKMTGRGKAVPLKCPGLDCLSKRAGGHG